MNKFTEYTKQKQNNNTQRIKIKSKYFGQYQPQLYIASRSKSKSNSNPKIEIKKISPLAQYQNTHKNINTYRNYSNDISSTTSFSNNVQKSRSPSKNINLADFLQKRQSQKLINKNQVNKDQTAIQKIIKWVQKKYYGKNYYSQYRTQNQLRGKQPLNFQQKIKNISYDLYVLKQLKNKNLIKRKTFQKQNISLVQNKQRSSNYYTSSTPLSYQNYAISNFKSTPRQNAIDQIQGSKYYQNSINSYYSYSSSAQKNQKSSPYRYEQKQGQNHQKSSYQKQEIDNSFNSNTIMNILNSQRDSSSKQSKNVPLFPISEISLQNYIGSDVKMYESKKYQNLNNHISQNKFNLEDLVPSSHQFNIQDLIPQNSSENSIDKQRIQYQLHKFQTKFTGTNIQKQSSYQPSSINMKNISGAYNNTQLLQIQRDLGKQSTSNIKIQDDYQNLKYSDHDKTTDLNNQFKQEKGGYLVKYKKQTLQMEKSINFNFQSEQPSSYQKYQYLSKYNKSPQSIINVAISNRLSFSPNSLRKTKNSTCLCDIDYYPNALFHPQILPQKKLLVQNDTFNIDLPLNDQILSQIFQMNNSQQQANIFLNSKNNKNESLMLNSKFQSENFNNQQKMQLKKTIETKVQSKIIKQSQIQQLNQIKKVNKTYNQNYFSQHLVTNDQQNTEKNKQSVYSNTFTTLEMPLSRANNQINANKFKKQITFSTNIQNPNLNNNLASPKRFSNNYVNQNLLTENKASQSQMFTFNSLNSPTNSYQNQKIQSPNKINSGNAFAKNCNLFDCMGNICPTKPNEINRSNYFTEGSTTGRERLTSQNSNQSKQSSKPKVNFKYVSPPNKIQTKNHQSKNQQNNSILFKSQSSHLKNSGNAPVKILVKTQKKNPKNEQINKFKPIKYETNPEKVVKQERVRDQRTKTFVEQRNRCYSVPRLDIQNNAYTLQKRLIQIGPQNYFSNNLQKQQKNAFVTQSYLPYQSQKINSATKIPSKVSIVTPVTKFGTHQNSNQTLHSQQMISSNFQKSNGNSVTSVFMNLNGLQNTTNINFMPHYQHMTKNVMKQSQAIKIQDYSSKLQNQGQFSSNQNGQYLMLYPLNNSKQKNRNKRARSLNEKILVTVKNKK